MIQSTKECKKANQEICHSKLMPGNSKWNRSRMLTKLNVESFQGRFLDLTVEALAQLRLIGSGRFL